MPVYDSETGEKSLEVTPYDHAKEVILHEFQQMTPDELLDLYRHFANNKSYFFPI